MSKTETWTLEPAPGMKSSLVGLFLAQLDDQNRNLAEDTRGLTPDELEWQPAPGMNTIGMLFAHIALVEVAWIGAAAQGLEFFKIDELPVKWADSGIPLAPEAAPPSCGAPGFAGTAPRSTTMWAGRSTTCSSTRPATTGRSICSATSTAWHVPRSSSCPVSGMACQPAHAASPRAA